MLYIYFTFYSCSYSKIGHFKSKVNTIFGWFQTASWTLILHDSSKNRSSIPYKSPFFQNGIQIKKIFCLARDYNRVMNFFQL